ncbi:hypothetical protein [Microbulbifer sp. 2205BS26-8]|uniref:hypothetical protein n=1 Tax=Microbulbifer sp. 2205BS26-8 TaxID=3064386 RepID=UPI00273D90BE|nr:hypothetical protein [Microbulbifer sp. 2205BS26-8]MDP5208330.1 hypothetical protein [Microbulbifer sp. 2205BS26-8]
MKHFITILALSLSLNGWGQMIEEVIVTAARVDEPLPGVVLKKTGDFLLLEVEIWNDSRDEKRRKEEIYQTLKNALSTASRNRNVELSIVESGFVMPLTLDNHRIELKRGSRPDTTMAKIRVKTAIPSDMNKATKLVDEMTGFVDEVNRVGRTEFNSLGSVDVSVVNPNQYRSEIIALFSADAKAVATSLGEDYKVIVEGIDRPVQWVRVGPLQLALYVPYSYNVIPNNINSIIMAPDY